MPDSVRESIYEAIASIRLVDPHTHINPHAPASSSLADLLGYHYYTELAHSAGMPKDQIEEPELAPRELVRRLVSNLAPIENTAQYRWLVEICRMFFGFDGQRIDLSNWEQVYDSAEAMMHSAEWPQMVLDQSNVEAVFLTNDFDDPLSGFDTDTYIPCLRTDDLVFHLPKHQTRQRLAACTGIELDGSLLSLRESLKQRFEHFVGRGARACAISLPPTFEPTPISDGRAATALDEVLRKGPLADPSHQLALSRRVFWTLAELCDEYGLPFDLMIGVNRGVYADGVYQGQDLYDSRVSLIQYRELFNAFPAVKFPISVLASVTNQELVSYAWIFPNVITNGHWWYSNTPSFIARDAAARLEAVPQTKQIAYYSDAYKLEFVWPKFDMYRRVLAGILADHFVKACGWSEERAIELGRRVLRDNVDEIFPRPGKSRQVEPLADTWASEGPEEFADETFSTLIEPAAAGTSAALAAGAIGMVEVDEASEASESEPAELEQPDDRGGQSADADDVIGFSTIIDDPQPSPAAEPTSHEQNDDDAIDDQGDSLTINDTVPFETIIDEPKNQETVRMDDEAETSDEAERPDVPTTLELNDTVRIDESNPDPDLTQQLAEDTSDETIALELDPLPNAEELQAVGVDDVELHDLAAQRAAPDSDAIEAEADTDPLDVGDLLSEDDPDQTPDNEIRMLRGEESFEPDEESLKLQPDPLTGELRFPVASSEHDSDAPSDASDDPWPEETLVLEIAEDAADVVDEDADLRILEETIASADDDISLTLDEPSESADPDLETPNKRDDIGDPPIDP